jgi:hypothetical protein
VPARGLLKPQLDVLSVADTTWARHTYMPPQCSCSLLAWSKVHRIDEGRCQCRYCVACAQECQLTH